MNSSVEIKHEYDCELSPEQLSSCEYYDICHSKFILPDEDTDLIQRHIRDNKNYFDREHLDSIDKYLPENAIIIDAGANIGNHSLYWANERNAKKIYALEPVPRMFSILRMNVVLNNLENTIIMHNAGVTDRICNARVSNYDKFNIGGTTLSEVDSGQLKLVSIDSMKINEKVDLIKLDVENMELKALQGAEGLIKRDKPVINVESFPQFFPPVDEYLNSLGYTQAEAFWSDTKIFLYEYVYIYSK